MKLPGDFTQSAALYVLAANSDRKGIERLLKESESIDRGSERRAAASILYQRYAELDPAAAVEHMMSSDDGFDPSWLYTVFYNGPARTSTAPSPVLRSSMTNSVKWSAPPLSVRATTCQSVNVRPSDRSWMCKSGCGSVHGRPTLAESGGTCVAIRSGDRRP